MKQRTTPLERAIDHVGGQAALARILARDVGRPIRQGHIWSWLNRSKKVPAEFVIPVERATEGSISRHELRPDIYPTGV